MRKECTPLSFYLYTYQRSKHFPEAFKGSSTKKEDAFPLWWLLYELLIQINEQGLSNFVKLLVNSHLGGMTSLKFVILVENIRLFFKGDDFKLVEVWTLLFFANCYYTMILLVMNYFVNFEHIQHLVLVFIYFKLVIANWTRVQYGQYCTLLDQSNCWFFVH